MRNLPEILEVDDARLEDVLRRVEQAMDAKDAQLLRALFESYAYVSELIEDKNTSIQRLRQLFFGARTEKTKTVTAGTTDQPNKKNSCDFPSETTPNPAGEADAPSSPDDTEKDKPAAAGHGRHSADAYGGAERVDVRHPTLKPGDACPACGDGTVYDKQPGVLVRITGQPPLAAKIYELQKLRCGLCGQVFTAPAPAGAGDDKYDATAASMIGLLKYGSGLPFNRLEGLQGNLEVPLPASTQWDIVHAAAEFLAPAFEELIRQAAQGDVLHNDDTTVKILESMRENRSKALTQTAEDQDDLRTGLFTSGVVALREGRRVALFFSGRQHAGENLTDVLRRRAAELPAPIQMCDALSRNLPKGLETIVGHCLAHARRQFVDVHDRFPEPCRHLLESLAVVYRTDAKAKDQRLSPQERLELHQRDSEPTMQQLHEWLKRQFDDRLVEPNSALGGAIRYLLKHWEKLTLFLRRPGVPLDNNLCERALKKAILHRKNALFYKTQNGARVGDLYMSLIYTCQLNDVNPFDYLNQLQKHADQLLEHPESWLPWNYAASLS